MNCTETRDKLDAYIDDELDEAGVAQLDRHFASCADCTALREARRTVGARLRADAPYSAAPERLRLAIERRLRPEKARPRRAPAWSLAGALAAGGAAAGLLVGIWLQRPHADDPLLDHVVASHVASLGSAGKLVEVSSSDRHAIKPWFAGRTDFAPLVRELDRDGFALVGGRLDRVGDRDAAAVVYRIRNHYVNLFMWRAPSHADQPFNQTTARGFAFASWSASGIRYVAISDVAGGDLERFARLASAP